MQAYYRYMMIILSAVLVWAQSAAAVHDTYHVLDYSKKHQKSPIYEAIYNHDSTHHHDSSHKHDKSHNHGTDDCVMYKIFKKGHDKLHDVTIVSFLQVTSGFKIHVISDGRTIPEFRTRPSSRAPPLA